MVAEFKVIGCPDNSVELNKLINILKKDQYEIQDIAIDSLMFKSKEMDWISFKNKDFKSYRMKRSFEIPNLDDKFYPGFEIYEVCFENEQTAKDYELQLNNIIRSSDFYNEKQYDYIVRNGNRLIYILARAKMFEEYALLYKSKLEEMINN